VIFEEIYWNELLRSDSVGVEEMEREGMRLLDFVAPSAKVRDLRLG
jgi:hypothetical protein